MNNTAYGPARKADRSDQAYLTVEAEQMWRSDHTGFTVSADVTGEPSWHVPVPPFFQPVPDEQFVREPVGGAVRVPEHDAPRQVLIISADAGLCSSASEALRRNGFLVDTAQGGARGLAECLNASYSLVIVDAVLPVLDGLTLVQELRTRSTVPVLLIADSDEHCMAALDVGADDFVIRPLCLRDLLRRLQVVLRHAGKLSLTPATLLESDDLSVNVKTQEAFVAGRPLSLTNMEFNILKCLIRSAGKIVYRDELAAVLYQRDATPFERSIDVHISHLRKKMEATGKSGIKAIRGIGYLLASANTTN